MTAERDTRLIDLLRRQDADPARAIRAFVKRFNASYGNPGSEQWDLSLEDWQRYEFLGDRVLNLVVAQSLFVLRDPVLDEGDMTLALSCMVSNKALAALLRRYDASALACLIPGTMGTTDCCGEKMTGGAFEAFIGALYCEFGVEEVAGFVDAIMGDTLKRSFTCGNAIGELQEYFQKEGKPCPSYEEVSREGPGHRLFFTVRLTTCDGMEFVGHGQTLADARQDSARQALDRMGINRKTIPY
ncbi:MAG TPA: ribonuclease III domain-containing protein [Methanoregula sp.]|nr:ribonuclease III domain-containing protein [Methanoregula sp.]